MICILGSHALLKAIEGTSFSSTFRTPKDMDIIGNKSEVIDFAHKNIPFIEHEYTNTKGTKIIFKGPESTIPNSNIIEAELIVPGSTAETLRNLILNDSKTVYENGLAFASLDICYTLKMSHRYLRNNPHFLKTMRDIRFMRELGAKIRPEFKQFLKDREAATYWYKHPSLNKEKKDFFSNDGINYVYDHDSIHESVKVMDRPAYTYFQSKNKQVMSDMKKFFTLPEQIKLNAVYEESCVLALERAIIPYNADYKKAFLVALEKVCTSITSGKFREYAYENYYKVRDMYKPQTFEKFFNDVKNNKVDFYRRAA